MTTYSRPSRHSRSLLVVVSVLLGGPMLTGCSLEHEKRAIDTAGVEKSPEPITPVTPRHAYEWSNTPAPLVLEVPEGDLELRPWTTCWSGPPASDGVTSSMCSDGAPGLAGKLDRVRPVTPVAFWFGRPGWTFEATFDGAGAGTVTSSGPQDFTITPPADLAAGRHRVDVSGHGPEGDYVTSFVWVA